MRHKLATIGFSYLLGLFCASFCVLEYGFIVGLIVGGCFLLPVPLLILFKKKNIVAFLVTIALSFGIFGGYYQLKILPAQSLANMTMRINGTVLEKGSISNDNCSYVISTNLNGNNVKLTLYGTDVDAEYGDIISFDGKLSLPQDNAVFAESSYYITKGIFLKATAQSQILVDKSMQKPLEYYIFQYRDYIQNKVKITCAGDNGGLLCAMFMGDKSAMSQSLKTDIKRSGVSHLTAVSGMHLALIAHILMTILSCFGLKYRRKIKFTILVILIISFMVFFRLSPSVIRSGIMLIIYYSAELFHRKTNVANSVGFACLIILLANPCSCRDVGFLLSVAGTIGIGVLGKSVCDKLDKKYKFGRISGSIVMAVVGSFCAIICTLPFVALCFGGVSIVGILCNLLLTPIFMAAVFLMLLFMLTGGVFGFLLIPAGICSSLMNVIITALGDFKYAYLSLDYDFLPLWLCLSAIVICTVAVITRCLKHPSIAVGISLVALCAMIITENIQMSDKVRIETVTDGKNACVIALGSDFCQVVVAGDSDDIADNISDFLRERFVYKIDNLCFCKLSQNGLPYYENALSDFKIDTVYFPQNQLQIAENYDLFSQSSIFGIENVTDNTNIKSPIVFTETSIILNINGTSIVVGSVKNAVNNGQIVVYYDYKKGAVNGNGFYNIFVDRRQVVNGQNQFNIYCDKITFYIDENGKILMKGAM